MTGRTKEGAGGLQVPARRKGENLVLLPLFEDVPEPAHQGEEERGVRLKKRWVIAKKKGKLPTVKNTVLSEISLIREEIRLLPTGFETRACDGKKRKVCTRKGEGGEFAILSLISEKVFVNTPRREYKGRSPLPPSQIQKEGENYKLGRSKEFKITTSVWREPLEKLVI